MKRFPLTAMLPFALLLLSTSAKAQYYEIANQIPGLITPALSGSMNYKGFVEAHYLKGVGNYNADFTGISTSQGFQYSNWFFMGVGIGVDMVFSHPDDDFGNWGSQYPDYTNHGSTTTGVMIPLFTDFRFNIGNSQKVSFIADIKLGAAFLVGKDYMRINNGYITNQEYFYLRPSVGLRIPVNSDNAKQAVDITLNYQLLTSNYWSSWSRNVTLNALGVSVAYEW
ncbi:MAG: hypothetical protein NC328_05585 [Muribaculum sp.]|nr:hypothetical protein [Muribaculum sp.]